MLLVGWRHRYLTAFAGSVASLLVALFLLAAAIVGPASPPGVIVFALIACAVGLVVTVILWAAVPQRLAPLGRGVTIATSIVSAGAILGFAQFWYQNVYLPQRAPSGLDVAAALEQGPRLAAGGRAVEVEPTPTPTVTPVP